MGNLHCELHTNCVILSPEDKDRRYPTQKTKVRNSKNEGPPLKKTKVPHSKDRTFKVTLKESLKKTKTIFAGGGSRSLQMSLKRTISASGGSI